jgi:hypothetical protein
MKKVILFLAFLFLSSISFSQVSFARAYDFYLGFKPTENSKITWSRGGEVDILVAISESTVKIYSSEIQEYRMVSDGVQSGNSKRYLAVDKNGLQCYLYLGNNEEGIYTIIEYSDYAWLYYLNPND